MRAIFVDNRDSFTFSIAHLLETTGWSVSVVGNDPSLLHPIIEQRPNVVVLGPGPGSPKQAGVTLSLIHTVKKENIPLLGICLGHQAINEAFGGKTIPLPQPVHGKTSAIYHNKEGLFTTIPNPVPMMRYHSLACIPSDELRVTAWTKDGIPMAIQHPRKPIAGIQFHPESILSHYGSKIIENFTKQLSPLGV